MRFFSCGACGHKMRIAGERCGKCFQEKPIVKTISFYKFIAFFSLMGVSGLVALRALTLYL